MQKAILVGNGFSSQLITNYKDTELVERMDCDPIVHPIRERYCELLSRFDGLVDKTDITNKLDNLGFPTPARYYDIYFEKYNLKEYIGKTDIGSIETLLKIGQLFSEIRLTEPAENDVLRNFACTYYWNDGANGLEGIKNPQFNSEKFVTYINKYRYVFTTNYDTILDDAYNEAVAHLHGSFLMNKDGTIRSDKKNCPDSLLIWGVDDIEKIKQIQVVSRAHHWNSPDFRWNDGIQFNTKSLVDEYFAHLAAGNFAELDIVGYSGENDKHINAELMKNRVLEQINFYCPPGRVYDQGYQEKVSGMFNNRFPVSLISWNDFWNKFMEDIHNAQPAH